MYEYSTICVQLQEPHSTSANEHLDAHAEEGWELVHASAFSRPSTEGPGKPPESVGMFVMRRALKAAPRPAGFGG